MVRDLTPEFVTLEFANFNYIFKVVMRGTVFFGNGLNRISDNAVSWDNLLDDLKADKKFTHKTLPNTMVYERIIMKNDELMVKKRIASAMESQGSNELFELLANMNFDNYLTTNYDYAFEKAIGSEPEKLNTEDIYSLRRKRAYQTDYGTKLLWNVHGEIENPKSIMLGLDHYCGSISKIDSYIKGKYEYSIKRKHNKVTPMHDKLKNQQFCHTSWIDLFFSSNVHIIGFSLDYSETDIWWLLNKRARFADDDLVNNKIFFYTDNIDEEKHGLLQSFDVIVKHTPIVDNDYKGMYKSAIENMLKLPNSELVA